jgi:type II secretory ATPase GspE/PulE/Tfp pilus assembly ATPase PilB-like protein
VRMICPACKRPCQVTPEVLMESGLDVDEYRDFVFHEGTGCLDCNGTGFRGRTAVAELLDLSDEIREMILAKRSGAEIKKQASAEGMKFMREAALDKVRQGMTTLIEINKVTFVD